LPRILKERNELIGGTKKESLKRVQLGDANESSDEEVETNKGASIEAIKEWSSKCMKDWLKLNNNKLSGTKQDQLDRIVGCICINKAAVLASAFRERKNEMSNLPTEEDKNMETDSVEHSNNKKDEENESPQKRKRYNNGSSVTTGVTETEDKDTGSDKGKEESEEEDDSSVETVKAQSGSGLQRTRFGLMLSPVPSDTEPDNTLILTVIKWFTKMKELDKKVRNVTLENSGCQ